MHLIGGQNGLSFDVKTRDHGTSPRYWLNWTAAGKRLLAGSLSV